MSIHMLCFFEWTIQTSPLIREVNKKPRLVSDLYVKCEFSPIVNSVFFYSYICFAIYFKIRPERFSCLLHLLSGVGVWQAVRCTCPPFFVSEWTQCPLSDLPRFFVTVCQFFCFANPVLFFPPEIVILVFFCIVYCLLVIVNCSFVSGFPFYFQPQLVRQSACFLRSRELLTLNLEHTNATLSFERSSS